MSVSVELVVGTAVVVVGSSAATAVPGPSTTATSKAENQFPFGFIIRSGTIPTLEFPFDILAYVAIGDFTPPVLSFLACGKPEFDFCPWTLEIDAGRDQSQALLLGGPRSAFRSPPDAQKFPAGARDRDC